jgi:hypothetical protein
VVDLELMLRVLERTVEEVMTILNRLMRSCHKIRSHRAIAYLRRLGLYPYNDTA